MEEYYYCPDCDTEISIEDIDYDRISEIGTCCECGSPNGGYYVIHDLEED